MASKPPKLTVTVSGPIDSGKTHLLIKLQQFLKETYGTEVKIKADPLILTRYDGFEHGPARPHRGSEIELRSETVSDLKLVIDPDQPGIVSELVVHSKEHRLTVYRDTQRVYSVQGVARMLVPNVNLLPLAAREWAICALAGSSTAANPYLHRPGFIHNEAECLSMQTTTRTVYRWETQQPIAVEELNDAAYAWARLFGGDPQMPRKYVSSDAHHLSMSIPHCKLVDSRTGVAIPDWGTLSEEAFDWALNVARTHDCWVMADLHAYRRRPHLIGLDTPLVPKEEARMPKILHPRKSWLTRLQERLLGQRRTTYALDDLKVTSPETAYYEETRFERTGLEPVKEVFVENVSEPRRVSTGVEPHIAGTNTSVEQLRAELDGLQEHINASMGLTPAQQGVKLPPPVEVDDFTLTLDTRIEDTGLLENHCITTPDDAGLVTNERLQDRYAKVEGTWVPAPDGKLKDGVTEEEADAYLALHYPESQRAHEIEAATQEVIERLGGIVPDHHGHARKVMPLEGPTGKKSNFNVRTQKPHGKKKPRR